jgi:hypothetical protein
MPAVIEFTDWALDILRRSHRAATRFNPNARIRLARTAMGVQAVLTDEPDPADSEVKVDGFTIHVEKGLEGLVDIQEPHDRLVLRPAGSRPNVREEH